MAISARGAKMNADIVKAWLDGATVEYRYPAEDIWVQCPNPSFSEGVLYRLKPEPKTVPWTWEDWERERPEWIKSKSNGDQCRLVGVVVSDKLMQYGAMVYGIGCLNRDFTQLDGTPFEKPAE